MKEKLKQLQLPLFSKANAMGAIAAASREKSENAVPLVITMLEELSHRGADTITIATPTSMISTKSFHEMRDKKLVSDSAVGVTLSRQLEENQAIVRKNKYALALEGHLFPPSTKSDTEEIANELEPEPLRKAAAIIERFDGSFAYAIELPNRIIAGRDLLGTMPLFFGQKKDTCAIASERKALWKIGIAQAESLPLGNLATLTQQGFKLKQVVDVTQPNKKTVSLEKAANRLHVLLQKSTSKRVKDTQEVAVAFSGGLDSSVIAVLARKFTKKVRLITVGLEAQPELQHAEMAAKALELPIHVQTYTVGDIENVLKKVLWLIEEPDVMKAGVATPLFWVAQNAFKTGCQILLAGQGADELFGGYHKYLKNYAQGGDEALEKAMFHDIATSHETNFQRDNCVCAFHKVELRLPFVDQEVVRFALSLPANLKIRSAEDKTRKHVLRLVAKKMKIPAFISDKTKKAVQYTTGVDKGIRELARRKGVTPKDYVKQLFEEIYPQRRNKK